MELKVFSKNLPTITHMAEWSPNNPNRVCRLANDWVGKQGRITEGAQTCNKLNITKGLP